MVAFVAQEEFGSCFPILQAIARATEVELVRGDAGSCQRVSGVICIESPGENCRIPYFHVGLPSFIIKLVSQGEPSAEIRFSRSAQLPSLLRGRRLVAAQGLSIGGCLLEGETLAEAQGVPLWTTRLEKGVRHDENIQIAPWIAGDKRVFQHLNGHYFMRLLPLIEWLRGISNWEKWEKPALRACFMFDDPCLHALSYGYLRYIELVNEGKKYNFHTSLATIPLDSYYISEKAASIFRENRNEISLLFHGIDHMQRELAGDRSENDCRSLIRQALARIHSLERRAGLKVAKVMAPPHGAFGVRMMRACASLGFEAACVSWGSIWSSNRDQDWTRLLGADPGRIVEGLAVIPRIRMAADSINQILLAAYLGQPVIVVGHHWDVAKGLDLLRELAAFVNDLGDVKWGSMDQIARGNFWWRIEGETFILKPFSKFMEFFVPEGIREIKISKDWLEHDMDVIAKRLNCSERRSFPCERAADGTWTISVTGPCKIMVEAKFQAETDDGESVQVNYPLKALVRRLFREGRDHMMPYLPQAVWKRLI